MSQPVSVEIDMEVSTDTISDPLGVSENFVDIPQHEHTAFKAARRNHIDVIEESLSAGFDINTRHEESPEDKIYAIKWLRRQIRLKKYTLLHMAVVHAQMETLDFLLSKGADANQTDENGISPVSVAAAIQRADVVQCLIQAGADVNIQSISGRTPLIQAITSQNLTIVQKLLDAGADPNLADSKGCTPLFTCLFVSDNKQVDILLALINGGCDIERANKQGATALMTAVGLGLTEAVQVLLEAGADINKVDKAGKSVFQFSIGVKLSLTLINHGAAVDIVDNHGQRALDRAVHVGHIGMVRLLLGVDCVRPSLDILEVPRMVQARQSVPIFDQWLSQELCQPRDLKRICRGVIRESLGPSGLPQTDRLPIPGLMKDFILARNIDLSFGGLTMEKWQRLAGGGSGSQSALLLPRQLGIGTNN
ncbi:ankyrin [Plakobranchus ocellatus]|uniref:Ankyrin n=1 Tax=Plakobranchus ocellatus TaxID=259542 RepID=A0AAV4CJJ8_9GAST|nr:ankyrin [Plakobranchus ocellatus]